MPISIIGEQDFICITDIARFKDPERIDYIIQNRMCNRNTVEFFGIWEQLNNPDFNSIEFEEFKKQAGTYAGICNLARIYYRIHTDAIKQNLILPEVLKQQAALIYATEADGFNIALYGKTTENSDR